MAQHRSGNGDALRALDLWSDSLNSICVITIIFASIDATLLKMLNSRTPYNNQAEGAGRPANMGLACGIILYVSASTISFIGGLIAMREKDMLARRAEQRNSEAFAPRIVVDATECETNEDDDEKTHTEETPLSVDIEAAPAVDPTIVYVLCNTTERDAAAVELAPSHLCMKLISLLHQICLFLSMAGVALSFSGIVYEAQIIN